MITSTLALPDSARLPRVSNWQDATLMDRVWQRAQTLFSSSDNPDQTDTGYRIEPFAFDRAPTAHLYLIYKPRPDEAKGDYTESRYIYDADEQTCSCPFFCGIEPSRWHDSFSVRREGNWVKVYDRDGAEVTKDKQAHGYCKHQMAALLLFASGVGVTSPDRSKDYA